MMYKINSYIPTKVIFGAGRLQELATIQLPGKKALICVTADGLMEKLGIQQKVLELLKQNGVESVVYNKVIPNPTVDNVMEASTLAKENGCDFYIGLGGGSSIDTAKAAAIMAVNLGDIWDYASVGTGGRKEVKSAAPVVTISTTCGTGTEVDFYSVITKTDTKEKVDFALDEIFPKLSIIDPELMCSIPTILTTYQGFDALFHSAECYIGNGNENRLVDIFAEDAIRHIAQNLTKVVANGNDIEARTNMAYAADILGGYVQSLSPVTSHHIIAQALGGVFPQVPHGATLMLTALEYYKFVCKFFPDLFDKLGEFMGQPRDNSRPGYAFVDALEKLMVATNSNNLKMSDFNITKDGLEKVAKNSVEVIGFDCDRYETPLTTEDTIGILERSFA